MDVGDVEAFEIVVHVERPVGLDHVVSGPFGAVDGFAEGEEVYAASDGIEGGGEGVCGSDAGEEERFPDGEGDAAEIVARAGEIFDAFEFGHGFEAAVEVEAAAVIAAAEGVIDGLPFDEDVAAVGADVAEAMNGVVSVAGEEDGFVERAFEEGVGGGLAGDLGEGEIADELP